MATAKIILIGCRKTHMSLSADSVNYHCQHRSRVRRT
jgi:hypothetical protein